MLRYRFEKSGPNENRHADSCGYPRYMYIVASYRCLADQAKPIAKLVKDNKICETGKEDSCNTLMSGTPTE